MIRIDCMCVGDLHEMLCVFICDRVFSHEFQCAQYLQKGLSLIANDRSNHRHWKKRHFPPSKKQVEVVGSLGVYLNIFEREIYIYIYYIYVFLHFIINAPLAALLSLQQARPRRPTVEAWHRETCSAARREHLESVGIFLKICPEKWPARQELLLHLQRSFNNCMPD